MKFIIHNSKFKMGFLILLFLAVTHAGAEDEIPVPFSPGEKLVYDVQLLGITAGEAEMTVGPSLVWNQRRVYPLRSMIQSNSFVSRLYPVQDRVESYWDVKERYSHRINVKQHEGSRKREKQIDFDQQKHKATQTGTDTVFDIPPNVHDFLSVLYDLRTDTLLTPGHSRTADVYENGKNWKVTMHVLGRENITTLAGSFDTLKVQVVSRFEGIFLTKRDLFLWMTDDYRKIPVMIQSQLAVGSIRLALKSMSGAARSKGAR